MEIKDISIGGLINNIFLLYFWIQNYKKKGINR
jgi:hypothetical protein